MTRNPDPIAARVADLEERRTALIDWSSPKTRMLIEYCIDGLQVEEIAERHRLDVASVERFLQRRLEGGGRGANGRTFLRELGREDPRSCLDELALVVARMHICGHCRRAFETNPEGRPAQYCDARCRQAAWRRRRARPGYRQVEDRPCEPTVLSAEERDLAEGRLRTSYVGFLFYVERRERGEHPSLAGVRERRRRRECRPYRSWVSDSSFLRLTIGRLSDWGYLAAHVRSDRADGFRREFLEVPSYPQAEEVAQRIRIGEPGTWRELDLTP